MIDSDSDDHIVGRDGDDTVYGGDGSDVIIDGYGLDRVFGDAGDDFIRVHNERATDEVSVPDTVDGGTGDDTIVANAEDVLTGGPGANALRIENEETPSGAVTITDFDTTEDVLQLTDFRRLRDLDLDDFSFEYDSASESVHLLRGATVMAVLQGMEASDIPAIDLVVISPFEGR